MKVLDTRKTTPGLRALEKQAVAAGGGQTTAWACYDAILVKDNHIALAGGVGEADAPGARRRPPGVAVEVECASLADVEEALAAGAERLLLDNMTPAQLREAATLAAGRRGARGVGRHHSADLKELAGTGVQSVSSGALTHSAPALDLSMSVEAELRPMKPLPTLQANGPPRRRSRSRTSARCSARSARSPPSATP